MLLKDTDSLMYKIQAKNVYKDFYKIKLFGISNYLEDLKQYNNANSLIVTKMKDFVGLNSKMHTFIREDNYESKKAKGINKVIIHDELKYEDCKNILFNRSI